MTYSLSETVRHLFEEPLSTNNMPVSYNEKRCSKSKYMTIPVTSKVFEMPVFALPRFVESLQCQPSMTAVVAEIVWWGASSNFKNVERILREVLIDNYPSRRLSVLNVSNKEVTTVYYASHGLVLNKNFNPVLTCSWLIERRPDASGQDKFRFLRPLIRISPECFLMQSDPMQKLIAKKIPSLALSPLEYSTPQFAAHPYLDVQDSGSLKIKLEVDDSPFEIREACRPDINITDAALFQTVRDHLEEIAQ